MQKTKKKLVTQIRIVIPYEVVFHRRNAMNLIPKVNRKIVLHKGKLTVHEPLSYSGELQRESYAERFGLLPSADGMLFLSTDPDLRTEEYRLVISQEIGRAHV